MRMIRLRQTFTGDVAAVMQTPDSVERGDNRSKGVAGILYSVAILSSADTSVAVVIADAVGTVFTIGSTDFTTRVNYKSTNAAIVRDGIGGQLTVTPSGIGSGTVTVDAWVWTD